MPKPNISGKTDVPDYDFPSNRPDTDKTTHNVDYEWDKMLQKLRLKFLLYNNSFIYAEFFLRVDTYPEL